MVILLLMISCVFLSTKLMWRYLNKWESVMALVSLALLPAYMGFGLIGLLYLYSLIGLTSECLLAIQILRLLTTIGVFMNGFLLCYKSYKTKNSTYAYTGACLFLLRGWLLLFAMAFSTIYLLGLVIKQTFNCSVTYIHRKQ